jgi:hypothetical protein
VGETLAPSLTPHQKRIINFVAEYEEISVSQVQRIHEPELACIEENIGWPRAEENFSPETETQGA